MKADWAVAWGGWLTTLLAAAAGLGIAAMLGFGYRATREWQRSSMLLITLDTNEAADLLVTAVTRDMGAVQSRVLANRDWAESSISMADTSAQVALAFTRYPYPESFFLWNSGDRSVAFFNRVDRYPAWMPQAHAAPGFPVVLVTDPPGADVLRRRVDSYGATRFRYVVFNTQLGNAPYQIVARLMYADPLQEQPQSVMGFTVNLAWVRRSYFADIFSQVVPLAERRSRSEIGVLDEQGQLVWGTDKGTPQVVREFPLLFLNPSLGKVALEPPAGAQMWRIRASQDQNSPLVAASQDADNALVMTGAAALVLCLSLILAIRAVQAGVGLATMRSDFVSSVTHDLKMPLANIRVMADTLALRPVSAEKIQTYAGFLKQESKRLTRLVDNLLAYARLTDVADVYAFESIAVTTLVDDALENFLQPLTERFAVEVDIPEDLPPVRADRAAMMLTLDNLLDNAIRYSADNASIRVTARQDGAIVFVDVHDRGAGIPAEELASVRRKFIRGRLTRAGGSGLGLAIVSRIMTDHGGTFTLESTYGVGTVARIGLPVAREPIDA
jgi:signal transduction histidine kinase